MRTLYLFLLIICTALPAQLDAASNTVLLVVSGYGVAGDKARPGFEMDELSQAWLILRANGLDVEIASPAGGAAKADRFDKAKPYNACFLADPAAVKALAATVSFADGAKRDYAGVYVMGGKGAMFDLHDDKRLQALIARTYGAGGVIGAVCHGPAALVRVRLADGSLLLAGKAATGFSGEEEDAFTKEKAKAFAFQLEDEMRRVGVRFSEAPMMLSHAVADGRLVTGQNPYSTPDTTEALLRAMGKTPKARTAWADERSIALVAVLKPGGEAAARAAIKAAPAAYDPPLIAAWGHYRALTATDAAGLRHGLSAMEVAKPFYPEPQLDEAMTKARARLASLGG
ncbi:type 1 glutamine amidotransferase domain-containing protein [Sphingoaurantiacus capsulatus]|uniref:Type 1 glutamine amidotransferase domain-containing protein n=1 Tax=Sphingoaurantiacus capsulatus TaxID=1771310 RepID=A0ABV7XCP2_9SPHN